nr:translation initiation factor 2 [Cryptomonas borealis]
MLKDLYQHKRLTTSYSIIILQSSKDPNEEIIQLVNPLIITTFEKRNTEDSSGTNLDFASEDDIPLLPTKISSKLDKKTKKNEKDHTRDSDWNSSKSKLKKKIRSKINFGEDLDAVKELFVNSSSMENAESDLHAFDKMAFPFTTKQKSQRTDAEKKQKNTNSNKKRKNDDITCSKPTKVTLTHPITLEELSDLFMLPTTIIIKSLFLKGLSVTANQSIHPTDAKKLGRELGIDVFIEKENKKQEESLKTNVVTYTNLVSRPPIVTIMGHVDHGKTTLLDTICNTRIDQREGGRITQKIKTYEIQITDKEQVKKILFLDTPGHSAFYGMRSKVISISDIIILVVAADDGLRPQTLEAIKYINSAKIPTIVAINKIDKDGANIESIKKELAKHNLTSEEWGGDTLMMPISALQGTNIDSLLEMILLLSDLLNLQSNLDAPVKGVVLESTIDKTKGTVASLVLQDGTLSIGDTIVIHTTSAKIRGITNHRGESIRKAYPFSPITAWGLPKIPKMEEQFFAFKNEKDAKIFLNSTMLKDKTPRAFTSHDNCISISIATEKHINLVIKGDTQGSIEAIILSLHEINNHNVHIRILQSSIGEITATDLKFANTSKSYILAFNTSYATGVKKLAKNTPVTIKEFCVIYDLVEYVQSIMEEDSDIKNEEKRIGVGIVKNVFPLAKSFVAGTSVTEGKILKTACIHVIRNNEILYNGLISSLKKLKEDVFEVAEGSDCGIFINDFSSWKPGDIIEVFELVQKKKNTL